jgi:1-acyl-sn-glycerol-3-phosphate acyltransferase
VRDSDLLAMVILCVYACVPLAWVAINALRSPDGWQAWLLFAVTRLYCGLAFRWRANRRCPFPDHGPGIVIANHRSPVDPILILMNSHLRKPRGRFRVIGFLMAQEYYEMRGLSWINRAMQSIPVTRDGRDTKGSRAALRRLRAGELVGVFPEGGIGEGDELGTANPGIAWLALRSRAPVYPVFIHNAPRGSHMVAAFYTFSRVRVTYGNPIDLSQFYGLKLSRSILQETTDKLMSELARLGPHGEPEARWTNGL